MNKNDEYFNPVGAKKIKKLKKNEKYKRYSLYLHPKKKVNGKSFSYQKRCSSECKAQRA